MTSFERIQEGSLVQRFFPGSSYRDSENFNLKKGFYGKPYYTFDQNFSKLVAWVLTNVKKRPVDTIDFVLPEKYLKGSEIIEKYFPEISPDQFCVCISQIYEMTRIHRKSRDQSILSEKVDQIFFVNISSNLVVIVLNYIEEAWHIRCYKKEEYVATVGAKLFFNK